MGHLPFLGFRWLLKYMASCIDTQRSLALDWIMDIAARSSAITSVITIFHCSNYPLLKNSCGLILSMIAQNENNSTLKIFQITVTDKIVPILF